MLSGVVYMYPHVFGCVAALQLKNHACYSGRPGNTATACTSRYTCTCSHEDCMMSSELSSACDELCTAAQRLTVFTCVPA